MYTAVLSAMEKLLIYPHLRALFGRSGRCDIYQGSGTSKHVSSICMSGHTLALCSPQ
jgi:hypothetical protein